MTVNFEYYSIIRRDVIDIFPQRADRVLDVGCGTGVTSGWLKENGRCNWVAGIETHPEAARLAREKLDVVHVGNAEDIKLDIEPGTIDVVICADILEHMIDPWEYLSGLRPLLKEGGIIVASIPNVRYWKVSLGLALRSNWSYVDSGILDKTHLRFFVQKTIRSLFASTGFNISILKKKYSKKSAVANFLTFGIFEGLLTYQYLVVASKQSKSLLDHGQVPNDPA